MTIASRLNEWLSIVLKLVILVVVILAIMWGGMSIYANVTEKDSGVFPKLPDVKKAQHMVVLKTTGELLLTDDYDILGDGEYVLHGFFSVVDGKWEWHDKDILLNEKYFGEITIKRRGT